MIKKKITNSTGSFPNREMLFEDNVGYIVLKNETYLQEIYKKL